MEELKADWFARDTKKVAFELLGKLLCRKLPNGEIVKLQITETEAYLGADDLACHSKGNRRTPRTEVMFGRAGTIYVYFTYGIHWMLNVVTEEVDVPTAVLIRGAGNDKENYNGPAKLTKALKIDGELNKLTLSKKNGLWIENAPGIKKTLIVATPRVGINSTPEPWLSAPLRFTIKK